MLPFSARTRSPKYSHAHACEPLRDIDRAASESLNRPRPSSPDETHTTYGTFVDAAGMFFSDRLVLNAGVRRDIIDLKLEATAGSPQCAPTGRDERIFCPRPDS